MKIRKMILLALFTIALWGVSAVAFAHPPKEVRLSWNQDGTLTVTVDHAVNDAQKHCIDKVVVYVNDKIAAQKEYQAQTNAGELTDTFQLGQQPSGAVVKAEAFCVIMGSSTGSLTLP